MQDVLIPALASYLFGAIPFGLLLARLKGVDIRAVGSGNIGATNVFRSVGKGWGLLTLFLDALKGYLPAAGLPLLVAALTGRDAPSHLGLVCGCAAIAGHNWPVYLGFKGGKGVATSAGVLLGIAPGAVGIGLAAFAAVTAATRYVSLASIVAASVIAISSWKMYAEEGRSLPSVLTALALLVIVKHRANLRRLLAGRESKIVFRKQKDASHE